MRPSGRFLFLPTFLPTWAVLLSLKGGGCHGLYDHCGYLTLTPKGFWDLKGLVSL